MAKKHSSKTATQEAVQRSEPRIITYKGWQGVNYVDAPLTWEPLETGPGKERQSDLPNNYLMVQNNLITTDTRGIETRPDSVVIGNAPIFSFLQWPIDSIVYTDPVDLPVEFTGPACMHKNWVLLAGNVRGSSGCDVICCKSLTGSNPWRFVKVVTSTSYGTTQPVSSSYGYTHGCTSKFTINNIETFAGYLIVNGTNDQNSPETLVAKINTVNSSTFTVNGYNVNNKKWDLAGYVTGIKKVQDPPTLPSSPIEGDFYLVGKGMNFTVRESDYMRDPESYPVRLQVCRTYTTIFGSTLAGPSADNPQYRTIYVEYSPALWNKKRYVLIHSDFWEASSDDHDSPMTEWNGDPMVNGVNNPINGVDFYARENDNTDWVFIGHVSFSNFTHPDPELHPELLGWSYNWYGAMANLSQWKDAQLMLPEENNTAAVNATHCSCHDSRLFFWNTEDQKERLWIGGNPGSELSVARGLGGAWIDIEKGSGFEVKGTEKWKTASGANIVTILCGHRNTGKVKRFNLVETNLTLSNEVQYKSYMYEEVSNVTGCSSNWGHGVFEDGLYCLTRYGLMVVTMASEYNSQMKNQKVSSVIDPIFNERLGNAIEDARLLYINGVAYIALTKSAGNSDTVKLDNVILCYDVEKKAWYTFTHDETLVQPDTDDLLNMISIDSIDAWEGLGVITKNQIRLYPTTGSQSPTVPAFQVIMETGELMPRMPKQAFWYIQQLEFRFDYFISNPDDPPIVLVEGVDYYGREFRIEKELNKTGRRWQTENDNGRTGELRSHVEWVRVDKMVESLRIRIKGKARFRLTHINSRCYQQSDSIATPYGYDALDTYRNRKGQDHVIHHYIDDYNNLKEAVIS